MVEENNNNYDDYGGKNEQSMDAKSVLQNEERAAGKNERCNKY